MWEQITFSLAKSHIKVSLESVEGDDGEDEALTARQLHWPRDSSALHLQTAVLCTDRQLCSEPTDNCALNPQATGQCMAFLAFLS